MTPEEKAPNYNKTLTACYLGFITQAIVANFAPLLFLKFHKDFGIPLGQIALISTVFFFTQLIVDLFCAKFVDRIGYRRCVVASEVLAALGLIGLAIGLVIFIFSIPVPKILYSTLNFFAADIIFFFEFSARSAAIISSFTFRFSMVNTQVL